MGKIDQKKEVVLPQAVCKELIIYSPETGVITNRIGRGRARVGEVAGTITPKGYISIYIKGHHYFAHRLAWLYVYGEFPQGEECYVDHVNGDKSDNRITNLKVSSSAANNRNTMLLPTNKSGIVGVCRVSALSGNKTKRNWYWRATWRDENGKGKQKDFNIEKLGEDEAKQMALTYRSEQLRLLEVNFGIVYSERHGTEGHLNE